MALEYYHEPQEKLPKSVVNLKRALASIIEELEAFEWYNERAASEVDEELREILIHNRNEEIEHAAMLLEWVRRKNPEFAEEMQTYLFTKAPITELEDLQEAGAQEAEGKVKDEGQGGGDVSGGSLNIGSMKGEKYA